MNLQKTEEKTLRFVLGEEELRLVDEHAQYTILRGEWTLQVEESVVRFVLFCVCSWFS